MWPRAQLVGRPDPANVMLLDLGASGLIRQMEHHGIRVSLPALASLDAKLEAKLTALDETLRNLTGRDLDTNFSSDDQVADILFSDPPWGLGISSRGLKRTKVKGRPSVNTDELEKIATQHPAVPLFIERSEYVKLRSSYTLKIPKMVRPDGRLYDHFRQTSVVSGRLSSEILLTIPSRTELGQEVRAAFVPDDGYVLAEIDLKGIEFRCAAHDSRDPVMIDIFVAGDDPHWRTAENTLGKPRPHDPGDPQPHELTAADRYQAKRTGFLVLFGGTALGLQTQVVVAGGRLEDWPESSCQQWIDGFFGTYPRVLDRIQEHHYRAKRYELVWDWFGRVRYIPEVRSVQEAIVAAGLREAQNFAMAQSPATGVLKVGIHKLLPIVEGLNRLGKRCWPLCLTHDSLLFELSRDIAEEFMEHSRETLNGAVKLRCPVDSDYHISERNWKEAKG